ncbi:TPA: transcriptional regulator [Salmonella enterica]|nr:transcriptional regulator [Salmonella enterica]EJD8897445.1 transcriptional regulator [Salmonella enterica subsp. enterica serovar Bovismorbificans]
MTEYNRRIPAPQVIVHGDCWPVVSAVLHVVKAIRPESACEVAVTPHALRQQLAMYPDAACILCLRPREHLFLFYALTHELSDHPALVISDELLFSDRVLLHSWGDIPALLYQEFMHQEFAGMVDRLRMCKSPPYPLKGKLTDFLAAPKTATGLFAVPLTFTHPKHLMRYMALLMYRATTSCGITPAGQKLLREIHKGQHSPSGLKNILKTDLRKIWQDKARILTKLGMRNRLRELFYGTRFCRDIQRTPFMTPENTEQKHNRAVND